VALCPVQPGEELRWWNGTAIGGSGLVLVWVSVDIGPDSDPDEASQTLSDLVELTLDHIDARLG